MVSSTKRFYENGFECVTRNGTRRIPYSDVSAIYYLDQTVKQTVILIPIVSQRNVCLELKTYTYGDEKFKEQAGGVYGMGSDNARALEQVRDIIVDRVVTRMRNEIAERGRTCWANDVFFTESSIIQGDICIPYEEITDIGWNRLLFTVTIKGSRGMPIKLKTHFNLLPAIIILGEKGVALS